MLIMDKGKDTEMHPTHNEVISVQIIFRTLKKKIYKYMTSISKNVYIDQLTDIFNECNNAYQNTIKMNPVDIELSSYIDFGKQPNEIPPKFKAGDHPRTQKCQDIFGKGYALNRSEEDFVIKKN